MSQKLFILADLFPDLLVTGGPYMLFFCRGRLVLCHNTGQRMRHVGLFQIN